ncbi:MAG: class I SAM-dependent methyltransferase [Bacteroidia bacterium]
MGIKLSRAKPRNWLLTFSYRLNKVMPFSHAFKHKLFLRLEWIFERLAHEESLYVYDPEKHPCRYLGKEYILKHISTSDRVLDIGCNLGEVTDYVASKASEVIGIDHNAGAIQIASGKFKRNNLHFYHADARTFLKTQQGTFDVLILSHILEHLDNPKEFLLEFAPAFNHIYIEVPDFDKTILNHYRQAMNETLIYTDDDHVSEWDRLELNKLIETSGMEIIEQEYRFGLQKLWCRRLPS